MVHWTEHERHVLSDLWGKVHPEEVGPQALIRVLVVYPWTQRYFSSFGNLSNPAAIAGNAEVIRHGKVVLVGVDKALHHLDTIKSEFTSLSKLHSDTLHVDPSNFSLLAHTLTVSVAAKLGPKVFTAEVHEVWQKFLNVVVAALSTQYH
ncbi:hemoglobin subunit beta-like [Neoarius graeffei]|uniref:hemoglobin subunit beta-like n=1 Tax=Neoarius graeffei TaxID=443677 RepID=UPI00298D04D6|nr:hemoglobin subunit beta-like [Neoarius graeffei]